MTDMRHPDQEDLALHAMQLLSEEDAAAVQAHLASCSQCREEFRAAQDDLGIVALSVEQTAPSAGTRERFLQQLSHERRVVPEMTMHNVVPIAAAPSAGRRLLPWLGWAIAAGMTFSAGGLYYEREQLQAMVAAQSAQLKAESAQMATMSAEQTKAQMMMDALTNSNALRVTLNTTPAAKSLPQGRATYLADKGALVFIANNLEPLPIAKVYELWLIPADGAAPIPAGTFRPDGHGDASVVMPTLPKGVQAKAFGVTMEAEGGATKPTMPILLVGA